MKPVGLTRITRAPIVERDLVERDLAILDVAGSDIDASTGTTAKFTRVSRLTSASDFDRVFRESRRSADGMFTVLYRANDLGYPRLGLAIAKKRIRRAVGRNRLKRLIRESFRDVQPQLNGLDIVVLARDKVGAAPNEEVFASLARHWRNLATHLNTSDQQ
jgi:ribonuclease P protein component